MSLDTVLTQVRTDLGDVVGSVSVTAADGVTTLDVPVHLTVPSPIAPPCIFAGPDDPYIDWSDQDAGFGQVRVSLLVILAAPAGANDVAAAQVDEMLTTVLPRFLADDPVFVVDRVDQPGKIGLDGEVFLGAVIRLHTYTALA
jgi:hypothetical protein